MPMKEHHERLNADFELDKLIEDKTNEDTPCNSQESNVSDVENGLAGQAINHAEAALIELEHIMAPNNNIDVDELVSTLNVDQKRVFDKIAVHLRERLQTPKEKVPLNFFLSGIGGAGKSYFIKTIVAWAHKLYLTEDNATDITVAKTATTGLAAFSIEGLTLHKNFFLTC